MLHPQALLRLSRSLQHPELRDTSRQERRQSRVDELADARCRSSRGRYRQQLALRQRQPLELRLGETRVPVVDVGAALAVVRLALALLAIVGYGGAARHARHEDTDLLEEAVKEGRVDAAEGAEDRVYRLLEGRVGLEDQGPLVQCAER